MNSINKIQQAKNFYGQKSVDLSPSDMSQALGTLFKDGRFDASKLGDFAKVFNAAGNQKDALRDSIKERLNDPNLVISDDALKALQKDYGVDTSVAVKNTALQKVHVEQGLRQSDHTTTANVGQTADKTVEAKVSGELAGQNQLAKHTAIQNSHTGQAVAKNELSPEYKLAKQLIGDVAGKIYADKASPEMKAVVNAVGPQIGNLAKQTAAQVMADPKAMENLKGLMGKVGKEGFSEALATTTKELTGRFMDNVGVQTKDPAAIKAALSSVESVAHKLSPSLGAKVTATAQKISGTVLGEAGKVAADTAGKVGADVASKVVSGTAGTAAKTAGAALPFIGHAISLSNVFMSFGDAVSQTRKTPRDHEKTLKQWVNFGLQLIGLGSPLVALGGAGIDAAWSAKIGVSDQKKAQQNIPVTENANFAASLPIVHDVADFVGALFKGAGQTDVADKIMAFSATTKTMNTLDLNKPENRFSLFRKSENEALVAMSHEAKLEMEKAAGEVETGSTKQGYMSLASTFGALADVLLSTHRYDKRETTPGFDDKQKKDLVTKRTELTSTLMSQLANLGLTELAARAPKA